MADLQDWQEQYPDKAREYEALLTLGAALQHWAAQTAGEDRGELWRRRSLAAFVGLLLQSVFVSEPGRSPEQVEEQMRHFLEQVGQALEKVIAAREVEGG